MPAKTPIIFGTIINFLFFLTLAPSLKADEGDYESGYYEQIVTAVGTKTERSLNQIGASISVIDREKIERQMSRDIADIVRYEPGVSVAGTGE